MHANRFTLHPSTVQLNTHPIDPRHRQTLNRTVTVEEAQAIFDNFKVMKTSKAWKAFEASGDGSEEGVSVWN